MKILISGTKSGLGKYLSKSIICTEFTRDTNYDEIKKENFDVIIHCAFNQSKPGTSEEAKKIFEENTSLTKNLLKIPHKKFMFISSVDVYPKDKKEHFEDEKIEIKNTMGVYPLAKITCEELVKENGGNFLILRCSALLGEFSRKNSLIKIMEDEKPVLTLSKDSEFNYILHKDLLKIIKASVINDIRGVLNAVSSSNVKMEEVAVLFSKNAEFGGYKYECGNINNKKLTDIFPELNKSSFDVIKEFSNKSVKKKVLVCGASGFIGRNIAEKLSENDSFEVYGTFLESENLEIQNVKITKADLRKKEDVDKVVKGMDVIIQAAATTSGAKDIVNKPYYHVTDNAVMNSLIFRAAFENKVKHVIFFSCSVMYQPSEIPVREKDFNANDEIYKSYFGVGWTKVYIEKMCEFYSRIGEAKYTVIRHSNIYGPHDKYDLEKSHVFGATVTKVMTSPENGEILVWGTGEEERDLLYVSDLVDFVETAMKKQKTKFELLNAGLGKSISVSDLVKKIIQISGKNIKIRYDASKPTIKTKLCLDCSKAKELFGWSQKIPLEEGIKKTIEWYKKNISR